MIPLDPTRRGPSLCRFRRTASLRRAPRCASPTRRCRPATRVPPSQHVLSKHLETATPDLAELYEVLCRGKDAGEIVGEASSAAPAPLLLASIDELHFLDWHACALLAGAGAALPEFVLREALPEHRRVRVAAELRNEMGAEMSAYRRGAILRRFLNLKNWPALWHNYLTSRDARCGAPRRVPAGATLDVRFPQLRVGLVTGVDLFHEGEYYAAHEDWESLWVRLDEGPERRAVQSLIQLAGAHIHRIKGRAEQAQRLYQKARSRLTEIATELDWLDVEALIVRAEQAFAADVIEDLPWPIIPLRNHTRRVPRKHTYQPKY